MCVDDGDLVSAFLDEVEGFVTDGGSFGRYDPALARVAGMVWESWPETFSIRDAAMLVRDAGRAGRACRSWRRGRRSLGRFSGA